LDCRFGLAIGDQQLKLGDAKIGGTQRAIVELRELHGRTKAKIVRTSCALKLIGIQLGTSVLSERPFHPMFRNTLKAWVLKNLNT